MLATTPAADAPLVRLRLAPAAHSTGAARAALRALPEPHGRDARDDLDLLVSEVVSNSVRHAGLPEDERIDLRVVERGADLRVEVRDGGAGFEPDPRDPGPTATGGRGIFLLDRLARRWGVERERDGTGTCVWFELDWNEAA